jgi:hypothetical protein
MAHAQKPDFVFRRNGRFHLNRRGRQFSRLLAAEVCASALVMLDTSRSEVVWEYWLPTSFASFPLTSPPVRHRVPSGFKRTLPLLLDGDERYQGGYLVRGCVGFKAGLGTSWQTTASPSTNSTPVFELLAFHYTGQATWMFTLHSSSRILMSNRLKMQRATPVCSLLSVTVRVANLLRFVTQSGLHR